MRLFAIATLVLAPVAAFSQTAQPTQQASLKKPVAFASTSATPAATPAVAIASSVGYRDVIKATLTSEAMDRAQAEGGALTYTMYNNNDSTPSFHAPKLVSAVGRTLPVDAATSGNAAVTVNFVVSPQGVPSEFKVVRSAGDKAVEQSTIAALSQYRFQPATLDHMPVYAHLTMEISLKK
jgi:TonB family protein